MFGLLGRHQIPADAGSIGAMGGGVTWQGMVRLGEKWWRKLIRVVKVEVEDKTLLLATDLEIEAELIALIYLYRWQIEMFFKWLKSILGCRHLLVESPDGVAIQIYCVLIAALMLQLLTGKRPGKRAMELLRMYMMGYAELEEVVALLGLEKTAGESKGGAAARAPPGHCRAPMEALIDPGPSSQHADQFLGH